LGKGDRLWDFLTDKMDLAEETLPGQPIIEILGENRVLIENHRGVKGYSRQCIVIRVRFGDVHVSGDCLQLICMSKERLIIQGMIYQVSLKRRC
jgi:sporulation protein YqfC